MRREGGGGSGGGGGGGGVVGEWVLRGGWGDSSLTPPMGHAKDKSDESQERRGRGKTSGLGVTSRKPKSGQATRNVIVLGSFEIYLVSPI